MKAVRVVGYHQPLQMDDVPQPEVTGPHDVIVKIGGAGVCRTDLHILEGQWEEKSGVTLPYTIGHENAGWVHAVGSAVSHVAEGDKVILHPLITCGLCRACRSGDDVHCENNAFPGISTDGGYAEYLKTSARSVVKIDESLEPADVAALADAGLTAYHAVAKSARKLHPGDKVVMIGAGGLGHIGIQVMAALSPAQIVVVDRNPDALELARQIGADETVVADGNQVQAVQDLTGGGANVVFDFVAEQGAEMDGWHMTGPAGSYYVIGYGGELRIPTLDFVAGEKNIVGNIVGTYTDLAELMVLAQAGKVTLHTQQYPLDRAVDALRDLDAGKVRGRAILVP